MGYKEKEKSSFKLKILLIALGLTFFSAFALFFLAGERILSDKGKDYELIRPTISAQASSDKDKQVSTLKTQIPVYLVGEVKKPGIYLISPPEYLYSIIEKAGGLSEKADEKSINLAFEVTENIMIYIAPRREENLKESRPDNQNTEKQADSGYTSVLQPKQTDFSSFVDLDKGEKEIKININKADLEELCLLPGVGEATAKAIISYRDKNGSFEQIEDIMRVPGIKDNKFEAMKEQLSVG